MHEKRAVIDEIITPPELSHPTDKEKFEKKAKMWPKEALIDDLDVNHPLHRLIDGAEKAIVK